MNNNKEAKILNALRMGVIPDVELSNIISGRETEKQEINNMLSLMESEGCSLVKFIKGEYGTGKTFLLEYIKQLALKRNYVVANLSINSGFDFSKLDVLYLNIMSNLSIHSNNVNKGTEFEELFDSWIRKIKKNKGNSEATKDIYEVISNLNKYNNAFASVLLTYIRAKISSDYELSSIASSWIKGDKNISYELKKRLGVKGSVDRENAIDMLRGFANLIRLIGYQGLVIQVDEAEIIMASRSDIRMKSYGNIRFMMDLCGSNEIENTCFVFAGTNELFVNPEKGFRSYQALEQRIGDIIKDNRNIINNARQPIVYLREFSKDDYFAILENVLETHENYYNYSTSVNLEMLYNLTEVECSKVGRIKTVRLFIKKLIEILDLMENNPNLPIFRTNANKKLM